MQITVLGKSPSWQDRDGACSGYLVEDGGSSVMLDCGSGVFAKLRRFHPYETLDAVLITHLHADHFLDLVPFAMALTHGPHRTPSPRLIVPAGAVETFRKVTGALGKRSMFEDAFQIEEYDVADSIRVGAMTITFCPVPHYVPANAVQVTSAAGGRFCFGADGGPSDELVEFARDANLLVLEATLAERDAGEEGVHGHMTAAEAGEQARLTGAKQLVITHVSDESDLEAARGAAQAAFGAEVSIAAEGAVYRV